MGRKLIRISVWQIFSFVFSLLPSSRPIRRKSPITRTRSQNLRLEEFFDISQSICNGIADDRADTSLFSHSPHSLFFL